MTLAHEWVLVIFNAFSKVGRVIYEKDFGGRTRPDIYFEATDDQQFNFVADITAISDKGLDGKNPYDALHVKLHKIIREEEGKVNTKCIKFFF